MKKKLEPIFRIMEESHMIEPGMKIIAGVSGGADSVCLLYVLNQYRKQIPFELRAIHVEHGIRGQESLEDAAFTKQLCSDWNIECRICSADVLEMAAQQGISVEEAGRLERYRIFEEEKLQWGAERIAVAHNRNDQAETVLWNLVRGSGAKGLGGIRPVRGSVIRPLLYTGREEIEEILTAAGVVWRTDRTNLETDYTRNKIRLSLLPQMEKELNQQAVRHIAESAQRLQELQAYLDRMTERAAADCICAGEKEVMLLLEPYRKEDPMIRKELLRRLLETCGGLRDVGAVHLDMLEQLAENDCGKRSDLPDGLQAVREQGILKVFRKKDRKTRSGSEECALPVPGTMVWNGWEITTTLLENCPELQKEIEEEKKYTKWLSYDTILDNVQVRTRKTGDYLVINSSGGKKKLKDFFIDQKIPAEKRDDILLFADGSHVLWVAGSRISMAAKVSRETKMVLKIQMKEELK